MLLRKLDVIGRKTDLFQVWIDKLHDDEGIVNVSWVVIDDNVHQARSVKTIIDRRQLFQNSNLRQKFAGLVNFIEQVP